MTTRVAGGAGSSAGDAPSPAPDAAGGTIGSMPAPLDDHLCFVMSAASRAVTNAYRPGLARLGLTYPQFVVLLALSEHDGLGVVELARRARLDVSTLSPLLKRMEGMGLLVRARSMSDERRVSVRLTDAGARLTGPAAQVRDEVAARLSLTPEQAETLRTLSRQVIDDYTVDGDPAAPSAPDRPPHPAPRRATRTTPGSGAGTPLG